jgi:serine protease AprX
MSRGLIGGFFVALSAALFLVVAVDARQPSPARPTTFLVQLAGPVLDTWKAELAESGAELLDYVPHFAFRARMTPDAAARVRRLPFVTAVTSLRNESRMAPGLRRDGRRPYVVRLDRGSASRDVEALLRSAGIQVSGRGGRQLLIVADGAQLDALAGVDGLAAIENFTLRIKHNEFGGGAIMRSGTANATGYDGSTQTIAVADTGLGLGTAASAHVDLPASRMGSIFNWPGAADFCFETIVNDGALDADTGHGTHVATAALGGGDAGGVGRGTAPAATLVFQAIENYAVPSLLCGLIYGLPEGYYLVGLPDDIGDLFHQAYQQGARVHSNSWGAEVSGAYTADSANADAYVWAHRDLAVTFSAGNAGTDADADGVVDEVSLSAPGTAKNVITVGASENDRQSNWECDPSLSYTACAAQGGQNAIFTYGGGWPDRYTANPLRDDPSAGNAEQMAAFSSRGPTADGRIKPDVVAPGTWTLSGYSNAYQQQYDASANPVNGQYQYDGWGIPASAFYKYMGGTSMAAPLVAGGAAVVRDFYQKARGHQASAALVKAALINSAVDLLDENNDGVLDNAHPIPNVHEGWGRVDLVNATDAGDHYDDETQPLSTGTSASLTFDVTSPGTPFKATLAWTDYPASTTAEISLVNDLDLTVVAPDGTTYKGNVFSDGWSATGGAFDRRNNVENVYVFSAAVGTWTITVSGYNVPEGPQPFALVVDTSSQGGSALPLVRLTVDDGSATEAGPTGGTLRVTRNGDTTSALEVAYAVSGTATAGADFSSLTGVLTIPAGAADATIAVDALDDPAFEPAESVVVTLLANAAYTLGSPSSGAVTIASDDLPPDFSVTAVSVPVSAAAGATIAIQESTRNIGTGPAPESRTGFYLSANATWDASDEFLGERVVSPLTAGATQAANTPVVVPAATAAGAYYVIAKADWGGLVNEATETNNTRSDTVNVGPDLSVSAFSAPPTAAPGGSISVTDTTKNLGAAPAGASTTSFFLSTNNALDAADVSLGSRPVALIGGGATQVATTPLVIPASTPGGAYYVLAQADSAGVVSEYLETNNVRASARVLIGADLSVTVLTAPADMAAGQAFDVSETTANVGTVSAPATITRFYWSVNSTLDATDTLLGMRALDELSPGAVNAATLPLTVPASASTGSYYLFASVDDNHELPEMSETNNLKKVTINVGPDLVGLSLTAPSSVPGGVLAVTDSTQNAGGSSAGETVTSFYLSSNNSLGASDILIGSRTVPPLAAGAVSTATTEFTIPATIPASRYYLLAKVDAGTTLLEVSESNNVKAGPSIGVGPDLVIHSVAAPSIVVRGTPFVVGDTTRNDGGAAAATTTAYYLSVNTSFDASDLLLGSRSVSALSAGGSETGQATVVIPAGQATGNYYVIAKSDSANVAVEISETNNGIYKSIKINP